MLLIMYDYDHIVVSWDKDKGLERQSNKLLFLS